MITTLKSQTAEIANFDKWNYNYDGMGKVTSEQNPYFNATNPNLINSSDGVNKTFYFYDPLGRVTKVIGPDGAAILIDFNHWVITAYDQNNHRKQYLLDAHDRIRNVVEYNWDDIVRKDEVYNTSYLYDTTDNLIYINDTLGNEFRFRYDSLGRKVQLDDPDIGTYTYKYDLIGNLIQQVGGGGNLITGDGYYREYNELNQLIRARNGSNSTGNILEEYTYDPNGDRIKIKRYDAANTTVYTPYREWTRIVNVSGTYDYTYVYDGSTLVARINPDGSKNYFHDDHLGSTTLITNQSGAIIEQTFFEPFGSVVSGGTAEDKLYTGQFSDDATGQYYYGARYYLPGDHQFISPDSVIQNAYDTQSFNHYAYARNNPYVFLDPDGRVTVLFQGFGDYGTTPRLMDMVKNDIKGTYDVGSFDSGPLYGSPAVNNALDFVHRSLEENPNQPIVIAGISLGGLRALQLQESLMKEGIAVDLVITIDPVIITDFFGEQYDRITGKTYDPLINTNFYQTEDLMSYLSITLPGANNQLVENSCHGCLDTGNDATNMASHIASQSDAYHSGQNPNRYSSEGGRVKISADGRATLGYGGQYKGTKCYASSCSVIDRPKGWKRNG